jgi:photoactive yellow protein
MTREHLSETARMTRDQLNKLPFGAVVIDFEGTVLSYNEYESRLSRLAKDRVVGKNFFRDVAPCTGVAEFEGRMRAFIKTAEATSESFAYFFPFEHGAVEVTITFVRMPDKKSVLIAVERVELSTS